MALVAAAAGSPGAPASEGAESSATARHSLTLSASARDVRLGQRVRLRGRLTRAPSGSGVRDRRVALQADPYPFGEFRTIARTRTGDGGRFEFAHRPRRNTRYRAATQTVTTRAFTVYADLPGGVRSFTSSGDTATVRVFLDVPRYARLPGRRVHVYVYHRDRPRGRRVGSALLRRSTARRWTAAVRFSSRGLGDRNFAGFCIREPEPDPWGRPRRIDRLCGSSRLPKP